jgi:hypothetical protein
MSTPDRAIRARARARSSALRSSSSRREMTLRELATMDVPIWPGMTTETLMLGAVSARSVISASEKPFTANLAAEQHRRFLEEAPTTAAQAATIILDGVKAGRWRILVGEDAVKMDALVRADPEAAYTPEFFARLADEVGWQLGR